MLPADESVDAVSHLLCRLIGECQAQNIAGVDAKHVDKIGVPVCKHASLTRSGSGDDSYSSFCSLYGFHLSVVQSSEFHVYYPIWIQIYQISR